MYTKDSLSAIHSPGSDTSHRVLAYFKGHRKLILTHFNFTHKYMPLKSSRRVKGCQKKQAVLGLNAGPGILTMNSFK